MPVNDLIQLRKGTDAVWSGINPVLSSGEPGYDSTYNLLKVGNGTSSWLDLNPVNLSGTYFNNAVSGLLPVKNIVAGSDISVSSISGIYTISNTMTSVETSASVVTTVFNKTGASIPKMTAVYINGGQGDLPTIQKALATADISSAGTYGITYEAIDNMSTGRVIVLGALTGLNTDQFNPTAPQGDVNGSVLYLSPTISGALTTTKPYAPYHIVAIGTIVRTHQNEGVIEVRVQNGYELEELHNVAVTGATNGQFLQYNSVSGLWVPSSSGNFITLQVNGTGVSISGHSHLASDITNFNEAVDDRVGGGLMIEGTGVNLTYNDTSGTLTIDNLHTEINILSQEPQGFVDKNDSLLSFNDSTRTFTIQPATSGGFYDVYIKGIKVSKTGVETVVINTGTALNYIHFSTTEPYQLQAKNTFFDFIDDVPIAYIHWNSDINQSTFFGEERHGIRMDTTTHKWIHNTFGMQYVEGLSIGNYTLLGNGSSNSHVTFNISDGTLYQEDIIIDVINGSGNQSFTQILSPTGYLPVYYHSGNTGQWVKDTATAIPLKYNGTGSLYNLYNPGPPPNWSTANVGNNKFFAMWIVATNDINDPVFAIMGQRVDDNLSNAENNNNWSDIDLTNIPANELKILYRLIFKSETSFTNTPKASLQTVLDLRLAIITNIAGVTQNDHGSLFGLGDDDHTQYVHIDTARTINATHTFQNGITFDGNGTQYIAYIPSGVNITGGSGNFTTLQVSGTAVPTGTGSANYVTKWTGTNSLNNSIIYDNGTNIGIGTSSPTFKLDVVGSGAFTGNVSVSGKITHPALTGTNDFIIYSQGEDTLISAKAGNNVRIRAGGNDSSYETIISSSYMYIGGDRIRLNSAETIINEFGSNYDFRVEGDNDQNLLFLDASTDRFGIGTSSPSYKLDVVGTGNFSQNLLVNGTGVSLSGHTHSSSQITDFNSSVSGLLPVKNIIAGTGISISSDNGNYTINSTSSGGAVSAEDVMDIIGTGIVAGTGLSVSYNDNDGNLTINLYAVAITGYEILTTAKDTFTVTPNYLVGNLQVYYNGFKLLDGEDYTATNGTSFLLSSPGASGDVVEWAGLGGPAQYAQLNHTHTISDITNFGSGVTGLLPTIANSGNNRVLTSTGSSTGINAESNFTFDGTSLSHHAGNFANAGDAQHTILVARRTTTDSTADVVLTLDGNTPGASNRPTIPAQSVWTFSLKLSAYNDTDSLGAWWIIRGGIRRNGANGTALVGSLVVENDSEGAMSGTSATVVADDTNEALEIRVTGLSSKNIRWVGVLDISQVSYGTP